MKLVIKYETEKVTFNLSDEEAKQMGDCVNIDLDAVPKDERQAVLQEACDESLNKPDYNNWHQYWRHQGESRAAADEEGEELDSDELLMKEVADDRMRLSVNSLRAMKQSASGSGRFFIRSWR